MEDTSYGNAMTEVALALAMTFFSIMVLAMISMGVKQSGKTPAAGAMLAPAAPDSAPAAAIATTSDDLIVVFHGGRFYGRDLKPLDPATIKPRERVLLALDPALPMGQAITARARVNVDNLIVSTLDERWLTALRRKLK